jgi:glycosyltransferase involved in cell wall biosynthesis
MSRRTAIISINASWNIVNFRRGLIAGLQREGFRVVALAPPDEYSGRLADLKVIYVPIEMDKQGISPLRDLQLLFRYRKALKEIGPDIYLGYTAKPNIYGSLAARSLGIPVINNVAGLGTAFIKQGLLTRIVSGLYRRAFKRSATVFFQNRDDMEMFVGAKLVRAAQARLLPGSGIDLERFRPDPNNGSNDGQFRFLLIARLLWDKGVREFVEAARLVRAQAPNARFHILGFLDVANRTAVPRSDVEAWVAEGLIDYLGATDDVRPAIAAADAVVLPSYREGLPRVLLEGGAMGKPLIATDVPGCRHVVQDGVNGFLCDARDACSLADAMLKLLSLPPAQREAMGAAARAKVEREFGEEIMVERYLTAIDEALLFSRR